METHTVCHKKEKDRKRRKSIYKRRIGKSKKIMKSGKREMEEVGEDLKGRKSKERSMERERA